jgi:hypothetical protein
MDQAMAVQMDEKKSWRAYPHWIEQWMLSDL